MLNWLLLMYAKELPDDFHGAVDDYLEICKKESIMNRKGLKLHHCVFLAEVLVARCSQSRDCCIGNHLLVFVVSPFVSSHFQTENVLRERSFRSIHLPRSECHPKL